MKKIDGDTWREEIGVRWSLFLSRTCQRLTGHRWGPVTHDGLFEMRGQTCRVCGTWQSVPAPPTAVTNRTHYRITL